MTTPTSKKATKQQKKLVEEDVSEEQVPDALLEQSLHLLRFFKSNFELYRKKTLKTQEFAPKHAYIKTNSYSYGKLILIVEYMKTIYYGRKMTAFANTECVPKEILM